jgi:hypothetical protein
LVLGGLGREERRVCTRGARVRQRGERQREDPRERVSHGRASFIITSGAKLKVLPPPLFYKLLRANVEQRFTIWAFEYHRLGLMVRPCHKSPF